MMQADSRSAPGLDQGRGLGNLICHKEVAHNDEESRSAPGLDRGRGLDSVICHEEVARNYEDWRLEVTGHNEAGP